MERDYKGELEEIMEGMTCRRDFECYTSGFRYLCKVQDAPTDDRLLCLEGHSHKCSFSSIVGNHTHCNCPLLNHISTRFERDWHDAQ